MPIPTIAAEDVLPGHPDRLCDAVAEAIVEIACASRRPSARRRGGRPPPAPARRDRPRRSRAPSTTRSSSATRSCGTSPARCSRAAGYSGRWAHELNVVADLDVGPLRRRRAGHPTFLRRPGHRRRLRRPDGTGTAPRRGGRRPPRPPSASPPPGRQHPTPSVPTARCWSSSPADAAPPPGAAQRRHPARDQASATRTSTASSSPIWTRRSPTCPAHLDPPARLDGDDPTAQRHRRLHLRRTARRQRAVRQEARRRPLRTAGADRRRSAVRQGPAQARPGRPAPRPPARRPAGPDAPAKPRPSISAGSPGCEAPDRLHARLGDGTLLDAAAIARRCDPRPHLAGSALDLELAPSHGEPRSRGYMGGGWRWDS